MFHLEVELMDLKNFVKRKLTSFSISVGTLGEGDNKNDYLQDLKLFQNENPAKIITFNLLLENLNNKILM